jgi:hypothetical protein
MVAIEVETGGKQPHFGFWDEIYMPNYYQLLGFTVLKKRIFLKFQKPPLSFLENPYTKDFINPESYHFNGLTAKNS